MSSDDFTQMREYIDIARLYSGDDPFFVEPEVLHEDIERPIIQQKNQNHLIIEQLPDFVAKLRSHMELDENQDIAMGVDIGMNRAADMIESLLRQYGEN